MSKNWATTRGSDKKNYLANSYSDGFNTYYSSKPVAKPKSGISLYLDNLIPNSQLKNNKNNKDKKAKKREQKNNSKRIVESPSIPWLANHNNGAKEPLMNSGLEFNVDSLINKLKGA